MYNYQKLKECSYHISELFHEFFGHANPESYKQSQKFFDANELNLHYQALVSYITLSWMLIVTFDWFYNAFDSFIVTISNYIRFLQC